MFLVERQFKDSVQSRVGYTQRTAFEDLDLGRVIHHHHVRRNVSELFRIELATNRKNKL